MHAASMILAVVPGDGFNSIGRMRRRRQVSGRNKRLIVSSIRIPGLLPNAHPFINRVGLSFDLPREVTGMLVETEIKHVGSRIDRWADSL
jgi:hypothetical protein